ARDEDRVEEIEAETCVLRLAATGKGASEYADEIVEGRGEDEFGRNRERVAITLEGGQDDPQDREEVDHADDGGEQGATPAGLAYAMRAMQAKPFQERRAGNIGHLRPPWRAAARNRDRGWSARSPGREGCRRAPSTRSFGNTETRCGRHRSRSSRSTSRDHLRSA